MASTPATPASAPPQRALLPWFVLAISLACALLAWYLLRQATVENARARFEAVAQRDVSEIQYRMRAYEHVLRGDAGLFGASRAISREEFRDYVAGLDIDQYLPGTQAIGFVEALNERDSQAHVAQVRAEGFGDYAIRPVGVRDHYMVIRYIEPFTGANPSALGYDVFSEPVRRSALERARDSGEPALTGKVTLAQDAEMTNPQPGVLMYLPAYRYGMPRGGVQARRAALLGYVFCSFRMNDLMARAIHHDFSEIDVEIFDGARATPEALLFDGDGTLHAFVQNYATPFRSERTINVAGRDWLVQFSAQPNYLSGAYGITPTLALLGGSTIGALLFGLTWLQAGTRARAQRLAESISGALRQSEARLDGIIRGAVEGVIMTDAQQRIVLFNPAAEKMFGCTALDAIGAPLERFIPQRFREAHRAHVESFGRTGVSTRAMGADSTLYALRADGSEFPIDASISRVEQDGEKFFAVLLRDIARRLEADARIRSSEQRLAAAQAVAQIGSYELSLRPREAYFWSVEMLRITGLGDLPENWSSPMYMEQVVHAEDRPRVIQEFRRMLKASDRFELEYRIVRPDGEVRWVHDLGQPTLGADGKVEKLVGILQDITERREAQSAIEAANEFNREIMASVNEGIIVYDRELRVRSWNTFMEQLTGVKREDALDKNIHEIFPDLRAHPVLHSLQRAFGGESLTASEPIGRYRGSTEFLPPGPYEQVFDDPRIAWTLTTWAPHRDQAGVISGAIVTVLDVTQLKRSQDRLQQANARLRELSAYLESAREAERARIAREIHDELAGTLTGIKMDLSSAGELAKNVPSLQQKLQTSLRLVDEAVQTTRRIINDLRPSILDNLGVWAAIEWLAQDVAARAGFACEVTSDAALADLELPAEKNTALFRMVQESLNNVWRHADATRVDVRAWRDGDQVMVEVSDDGKGFAPEELLKSGHWGVMGMHERARSR